MCSVETKTVAERLQVQLKSKTLLKLYTRVLKIKKLTRSAPFSVIMSAKWLVNNMKSADSARLESMRSYDLLIGENLKSS